MEGILGEIRAFGADYAPENWHICDGSLLNISEYSALFTLIGTCYGGNGSTNFALPNLKGRLMVGQGTGTGLKPRTLGSYGGSDEVALTVAEAPAHTHSVKVSSSNDGNTNHPSGSTYLGPVVADPGKGIAYAPGSTPKLTFVALNNSSITTSGASQAHSNIMPCVAISYIICTVGIFPPKSVKP